MNIFKEKPSYLDYNLVNEKTKVTPNYDLTNKEPYFDIYISPEKKLCIIGRIDNNYICWCSLTELKNRDINSEIFNHIANTKMSLYSSEYHVLDLSIFNKLKDWYRFQITRSSNENIAFETPFAYFYGKNNDNNGESFSRNIIYIYEDLMEKCKFRTEGGFYLPILKNYLSILSKEAEYNYYLEMKPLISILEGEQYLKLSLDKEVRGLYLQCLDKCNTLYNKYMNVVR